MFFLHDKIIFYIQKIFYDLEFSSRRRITINCYVRWDYGLEMSGAEVGSEISVAPSGDDKK